MKFPSSTFLAVLAAGLSGTNAFVPASSTTFGKARVASAMNDAFVPSRQQFRLAASLGVSISDAASLLKELDKMDDFDPDEDNEDDDDDEKAMQLLDLATKALEALDKVVDDEVLSGVSSKDVSRRPVLRENAGADEDEEIEEIEEIEEGSKSSFAGALKLIRAYKDQKAYSLKGSMEFTEYANHPEFPDVDLSGAMKMMEGVPPLNQFFSAKKILRLVRRLLEANLPFNRGLVDKVDNARSKEEMYEACFTKSRFFAKRLDVLPKPKYLIKNWEKDTEFARQFFCGTNPVMIEVAKDPEKQLSENMVKFLGKERLRALADRKRLLFVSYDDLADIVNPHQAYPLPKNEGRPQDQERYCYAPIVTFVYDEAKEELDVLGIQLERTPDARVYTKNTSGENEWLFVKSCVTTADSNMHEWVSHLGNTHLTMEPHIVAIYNILRKAKHPLYTFLKPICRDTLLLNWGARRSLSSFKADAFGDYQSSVGVGQFMQLIGKMWSRYSFFEKSGLPQELASRGFDEDVKMPAYLYREDGMKLWNAIGDFAKDFVDEVYVSDEAVASDPVVQEWATETTDPKRGAIPGFPTSFKDKDTVVRVLQTLMWMTSGLHAAVNFPQYDFYGYAPNKPLNMRADLSTLPENDSDIREWMFENMFPHISSNEQWLKDSTTFKNDAALDSLQIVHLLTLPSNHCIDNLSDEFATIGTNSYEKFVEKLDVIGDGIEARNKESKKAKKAIYYYLNPSVVPASIDI